MTDSAGTSPSADAPFLGGVAADRDPDDGGDPEVEPVEVLVQLAEGGEIDPWDVDLVEATDAFLERLEETDLRTSGRALFYAAVLLRMKSDALLDPDDGDDDPEPEPWETALEAPGGGPIADHADDGPAGFDPVDALEAEMDRRLERKQARGSPETLDELVRELREAEQESWWKRRREYDTSESTRGSRRGTQTLDYRSTDARRDDSEPTAADVTDTAHSEDIETSITAVREAIEVHYDRERDEVLFAEVADAAATPVTTYLALLFLSHRGAVTLRQDDLFGDLWIRDPAAGGDDGADAAAETDGPAGVAGDGVAPAADDD